MGKRINYSVHGSSCAFDHTVVTFLAVAQLFARFSLLTGPASIVPMEMANAELSKQRFHGTK